jgi:membrane-associated phospholipid phosphatase
MALAGMRSGLHLAAVRALLQKSWPVDWVQIGFLSAQAVILAVLWRRTELAPLWLMFDCGAIAALVVIVAVGRPDRPRRAALLRLFHGMVVVPLVFTQVGLLIQAMDPADNGPLMERIDRWLFFGCNPIEGLESSSHPVLTEIMQWAYTSYVILPALTLVLLAWKASPGLIARSLFSLLVIIYLSYLGYYLVPTAGPNIHNNLPLPAPSEVVRLDLYRFTSELPGVWATSWLRATMFMAEFTKLDCFPSGHVAVAAACAVYAFRLGRGWGWLVLPIAAGVILSTVYLRYHYVIDVIAGLLLAWVGVTACERLNQRLGRVLLSMPRDSH